jgi:hypothetical protein
MSRDYDSDDHKSGLVNVRGAPEENLNDYYRRKQAPSQNKVRGDAESPLAGRDRDADSVENFSYGKDGYSRPKDRLGGKEHSIWDEEPWKDKS